MLKSVTEPLWTSFFIFVLFVWLGMAPSSCKRVVYLDKVFPLYDKAVSLEWHKLCRWRGGGERQMLLCFLFSQDPFKRFRLFARLPSSFSFVLKRFDYVEIVFIISDDALHEVLCKLLLWMTSRKWRYLTFNLNVLWDGLHSSSGHNAEHVVRVLTQLTVDFRHSTM